ncbi:MAG: DUF6526 family protein [Bacteroidota bacterium]
METQNFKNHRHYDPVFHLGVYGGLFVLVVGSIINLYTSSNENLYSASLLVLASIIMIFMAFYGRRFALKAQDRAIRAEEKMRYFIATGKPMDSRLRLGQIIALRFASDEEFVGLCKKAIDENLKSRDIKMLIKNWRVDHHRV